MKCNKCGHEWFYSGNSKHPTCPNCMKKVFSTKPLADILEGRIP